MKFRFLTSALMLVFIFGLHVAFAQAAAASPPAATTTPALAMPLPDDQLKALDSDHDGLSDYDEIYIYHTDPHNPDSDGDGYSDGDEVTHNYDPNKPTDNSNPAVDKLAKHIEVDLNTQTLTYFLGPYQIARILVSTGVKGLSTPPGDYTILKKIPVVDYKGATYNFPHTRWNMMFKEQKVGNLYIHGAYWHHNFGHVMSHGCVNVSYTDVEPLYDWADVGTVVTIQ